MLLYFNQSAWQGGSGSYPYRDTNALGKDDTVPEEHREEKTDPQNAHAYKHLFGPVPSRRFGRSLGVDLVPYKTCSFDCIFCQLGRTTDKTTHRREYVPTDAVIEELAQWIKSGGEADYITLSGSGEPTLHSAFGRIIDYVHEATAAPMVLLTNGAMLSDPDVRAQAAKADIVKLSLSAWNDHSLQDVNRPHPDITFEKLVDGQRRFRDAFRGELWMEVFLVWGTNSSEKDVLEIAALAETIGPDRIQLNTSVRPPCEDFAYAVPRDQMQRLASMFTPAAEVIAEYSSKLSAEIQADETAIHNMLQRRPCTLDHICRVFGLHRNEALKYIGKLLRTGRVRRNRQGDADYYFADRDIAELHDRNNEYEE